MTFDTAQFRAAAEQLARAVDASVDDAEELLRQMTPVPPRPRTATTPGGMVYSLPPGWPVPEPLNLPTNDTELS